MLKQTVEKPVGQERRQWEVGEASKFRFDPQVRGKEHFDKVAHCTPVEKGYRRWGGPLSE